ncbi:unnamed protein product [Boreogadus saida]
MDKRTQLRGGVAQDNKGVPQDQQGGVAPGPRRGHISRREMGRVLPMRSHDHVINRERVSKTAPGGGVSLAPGGGRVPSTKAGPQGLTYEEVPGEASSRELVRPTPYRRSGRAERLASCRGAQATTNTATGRSTTGRLYAMMRLCLPGKEEEERREAGEEGQAIGFVLATPFGCLKLTREECLA